MKSSSLKNVAQNETHREGPVAKAIERQTAKLPSDTFLWLALGSIGASLTFQLMGKKDTSNFIGQWAPTFLIFGLYNKVVKVAGSDKEKESYSQESGSLGRGAGLASASV